MTPSIGLQESQNGWVPPPAKPLDEAVWQAWLAKGRARDQRNSAERMRTVKWVSIAGLLAAAGFWSDLTPYVVGVRFFVACSALLVMFQALHARNYAFAATFGVLALLYNPLAPIFSLSGGWQRALVITTAVPFVASLAWGNAKSGARRLSVLSQ